MIYDKRIKKINRHVQDISEVIDVHQCTKYLLTFYFTGFTLSFSNPSTFLFSHFFFLFFLLFFFFLISSHFAFFFPPIFLFSSTTQFAFLSLLPLHCFLFYNCPFAFYFLSSSLSHMFIYIQTFLNIIPNCQVLNIHREITLGMRSQQL